MQQETVHNFHSSGFAPAGDASARAPDALCRVFPILMPLKAKRNLRLALSAEEDNFLKVLIVIVLPSGVVRRRRKDHSISLLDNASRFDLVHEALFAVESITDHASHRGFYCLLFFRAVKGVRKFRNDSFVTKENCHRWCGIGPFANFIVPPINRH
jgi:hypothetical protein